MQMHCLTPRVVAAPVVRIEQSESSRQANLTVVHRNGQLIHARREHLSPHSSIAIAAGSIPTPVGNTANWLLPMTQAVGDNLGELPEPGLADAGYRSEDNLKNAPIEVVVALGREGKEHAEIDAAQYPHTAAMAAKLKTEAGQAAYRKRKWIAESPNGWIKNVLGFRQFSMRGLHRVRAEWKLVCMALNPRRMAAMAG